MLAASLQGIATTLPRPLAPRLIRCAGTGPRRPGPGWRGLRTGLVRYARAGLRRDPHGCRTTTRRSDPRSTEASPPGNAPGQGCVALASSPIRTQTSAPPAPASRCCGGYDRSRPRGRGDPRARRSARCQVRRGDPRLDPADPGGVGPGHASAWPRTSGARRALGSAAPRGSRTEAVNTAPVRIADCHSLPNERLRCLRCPPVSPDVSRYVPPYRPWVSSTVPGVSNGNQCIEYIDY